MRSRNLALPKSAVVIAGFTLSRPYAKKTFSYAVNVDDFQVFLDWKGSRSSPALPRGSGYFTYDPEKPFAAKTLHGKHFVEHKNIHSIVKRFTK